MTMAICGARAPRGGAAAHAGRQAGCHVLYRVQVHVEDDGCRSQEPVCGDLPVLRLLAHSRLGVPCAQGVRLRRRVVSAAECVGDFGGEMASACALRRREPVFGWIFQRPPRRTKSIWRKLLAGTLSYPLRVCRILFQYMLRGGGQTLLPRKAKFRLLSFGQASDVCGRHRSSGNML